MEKTLYASIPQSEVDPDSVSSEPREICPLETRPRSAKWQRFILPAFVPLFLVSMILNVVLLYERIGVPWKLAGKLPTQFGMSFGISSPHARFYRVYAEGDLPKLT